MKTNKWTDEENDYLKRHYPTRTAQQISKALDRSKRAIYLQASYLGISKKRMVDDMQEMLK